MLCFLRHASENNFRTNFEETKIVSSYSYIVSCPVGIRLANVNMAWVIAFFVALHRILLSQCREQSFLPADALDAKQRLRPIMSAIIVNISFRKFRSAPLFPASCTRVQFVILRTRTYMSLHAMLHA